MSEWLRAIIGIRTYLIFPSWDTLMTTLIDSKPPPDIVARIAT